MDYKNTIKELIKSDPELTVEDLLYFRDNIRYKLYYNIEKALKELNKELEEIQ